MMRYGVSCFLLALLHLPVLAQQQQPTPSRFTQAEIGKMASAMMDGDLCRHIVTREALWALTHQNPRDRWAASDNYDVDAGTFLQVKKTMLRLQSMATLGTAMNLWLQIPDQPMSSYVAIRLRPALSVFYNGEMTQPTAAQLLTVYKSGTQMDFEEKPGLHVVVAPVMDSLGHVAAVVEIVKQSTIEPSQASQHKDY